MARNSDPIGVVLAAGRGTRLGTLTDERSKGMMPVVGQPMIERVLTMLEQGGLERFVVVAHPEDRALVDHLSQPPWDVRVHLAYQGERLGMAHAVEQAAPLVRELTRDVFVLASCDNLYPEGHVEALIARQREENLDAALTLMWIPRQQASATGIVALQDDRVCAIIEKPQPHHIPTYDRPDEVLAAPSLYVLSTCILDYLNRVTVSPRGEREFPDALQLLIEEGGAVGGELVAERMTLTHRADLLAINRRFLRESAHPVEANLPPDVELVPPVCIDREATVKPNCRIGPEVYLESGCCVGRGTTLRRAVVLRGAKVASEITIEDAVVT